MSMDSYAGKLAIVTGGSKGIGKATAKRIGKLGGNVCIVARGQEALNEASEEIKSVQSGLGQFVETISADCANMDQLSPLLNEFIEKYDVPDYLINSAGYAYPQYIEKLTLDDFKKNMDVNYYAQLVPILILLPHFFLGCVFFRYIMSNPFHTGDPAILIIDRKLCIVKYPGRTIDVVKFVHEWRLDQSSQTGPGTVQCLLVHLMVGQEFPVVPHGFFLRIAQDLGDGGTYVSDHALPVMRIENIFLTQALNQSFVFLFKLPEFSLLLQLFFKPGYPLFQLQADAGQFIVCGLSVQVSVKYSYKNYLKTVNLQGWAQKKPDCPMGSQA